MLPWAERPNDFQIAATAPEALHLKIIQRRRHQIMYMARNEKNMHLTKKADRGIWRFCTNAIRKIEAADRPVERYRRAMGFPVNQEASLVYSQPVVAPRIQSNYSLEPGRRFS